MSVKRRRGFILIMVVGMLAVLVVLGLSFAEQSRADLIGAANSRDLAATETLAETGFEIARRVLADDRNVWSAKNTGWDTRRGGGWTSRWGYNPNVGAPPPVGVAVPGAGPPNGNGPAPNRANSQNFLDSWQMLLWNEEDKGNDASWYGFQFDSNDPKTKWSQRHPPDEKELQDVWQLQPLARVRRFRVRAGSCYGIVQVGITPRDGAVNLNDVFEPGSVRENPGWYETLPEGGQPAPVAQNDPRVNYASPDRRTLEYILGKRPEYSNRNDELPIESETGTATQPQANLLHGNLNIDDGIYNFRKIFDPGGYEQKPQHWTAWNGHAYLSNGPQSSRTVFYNAGKTQPNRYNFEGARYTLYSAPFPMSMLYDAGGLGALSHDDRNVWYPSGRFTCDAQLPGLYGWQQSPAGTLDSLFHGFGFDLQNTARGGAGAGSAPWLFANLNGASQYIGAGCYGHPRPHSLQAHFIPAVARGRFWTDLMAAWYFGGAPGYSSQLGAQIFYQYGTPVSNWASLAGSYDSLGLGSHWMPPTAHVWLPGYWNNGYISATEMSQGLKRDPGNMPPAKPAATYAYPQRKWDDDHGVGNAHYLFNDVRAGGVRACGVQENWGLWGNDDAQGRMYDAVNVNVTNFTTLYGLLTPEKIPSMLNRTVVAPHLHWKARMLDGAYEGMESFRRYDPNNLDVLTPYIPPAVPVPPRGARAIPEFTGDPAMADYLFGRLTDPARPYDPATNPVIPYDGSNTFCTVDPAYYRYSIHRHRDPDRPGVRIWGKMDALTPDRLTGQPADDVFIDAHYDIGLSPNSSNAADTLPSSLQTPRPDRVQNWTDWFIQRRTVIPAAKDGGLFKPATNLPTGSGLSYPEGLHGSLLSRGADGARNRPVPKPHALHGLPNPDYMLLYPGSVISYFWADQFRRYFPVIFDYGATPGGAGAPGAPPVSYKLVDDNTPGTALNPAIPVSKGPVLDTTSAFVPGINKDEAWRVTRIGRKYQEILADEIMDYQMNPWWPNPVAHLSEIAAPLDKKAYASPTRAADAALAAPKWVSYEEARAAGAAGLECQIPDYYAYFNRFWCRPAGKYKRNLADPSTIERGEDYREDDNAVPGKLMNAVENRGIYPQAFQYFGQSPPGAIKWRDRILDFPFNTLEDQTGAEWRYLSGAVALMLEPAVRGAPARNHPFKNWADFVAMLGHLVYRPPMLAAGRDPVMGVNAATACPAAFFDGSRIADGDALQLGIVARTGWWPISANYGEYFDPAANGPARYPPIPAGAPWSSLPEWERRIDEWRGRDASGLRVEHNYISEAAANDVLVNFSNGRVRPIDFDGDGIVTMTRRDEIPDAGKYWPGYPWHNQSGDDPLVQSRPKPGIDYNADPDALTYGLKLGNAPRPVPRNQVIQGCVTLPIKFRSNTFRVTVLVSLTDARYGIVYTNHRYSRVYSRVPEEYKLQSNSRFGGEFIQHSTRNIGGVDPEMSWLGVK